MKEVTRFLGVTKPTKVLRQGIHSGDTQAIPTPAARFLSDLYLPELQRLSARFGGYCTSWLACAEAVLEDEWTEATVPYPLWTSRLWKRAERSQGREVVPRVIQSGSLD